MKKFYLLATVLIATAATQPAMAETARAQRGSTTGLSGIYIGAFGGYDWSDLENSGPDAELRGWEWGGFAGYKLDALMDSMNGMGIGMNGAIEGFYGISDSDDHIGGATVEKDNEWGVSFRPGFSVIDELTAPMGINPYGIVGYRNTKFESTGFSERYDGFELGAGAELIAMGDLGLRAEYSHVWYGEEKGIDPDADDVRIGVSYHF